MNYEEFKNAFETLLKDALKAGLKAQELCAIVEHVIEKDFENAS